MEKTELKMTPQQLAHLGGGVVAYVREIPHDEAVKLLGSPINTAPQAKLFCLYNADGTPISISGSREAAVGDAMSHDLVPASVH